MAGVLGGEDARVWRLLALCGFLLGRLSNAGPAPRTTVPQGAGVRNPSPKQASVEVPAERREGRLCDLPVHGFAHVHHDSDPEILFPINRVS